MESALIKTIPHVIIQLAKDSDFADNSDLETNLQQLLLG